MSTVVLLAGALVGVFWSFAKPKSFVAVGIIIIIFGRQIEKVSGLDAASYLDEGVVLLVFVAGLLSRFVAREPLRSIPGLGWFAVFATLGVVSAVAADADPLIAAQGTFIILKGVLLAIGVAQIEWVENDVRRGIQVGAVVLSFIIVLSAINFVFPVQWGSLFHRHGIAEYRYGLPALIGPFVHPVDLAQVASLGALATLAFRGTIKKGAFSLFLLLGSIGSALMSLRRKSLVGLPLALMVGLIKTQPTRALVVIMLALPLFVLAAGEFLVDTFGSLFQQYVADYETAARSQLFVGAFKVAGEYFPLGAGFGRYGSHTAALYYSPEYTKLGFEAIWGLGPMRSGESNFLTDTQWPAFIGEAGFLGAIAFALALLAAYRQMSAVLKETKRSGYTAFVSLTGMLWLVSLLIESSANPVFTGPPGFGPFFTIVGVFAALTAKGREVQVVGPNMRRISRRTTKR